MSATLHPAGLNGLALATLALLTACGGGGSDPTTDTTTSMETVQSVSANAMAMPEDAASAMSTTLATTQVVIAGGQLGTTCNCPGGGTAVFTATGESVPSLLNGQLDVGEDYVLQFNACRSSAVAATVNGSMSLAVTAASAGTLSVDTRTQDITVTLSQRTLTLDGQSTLSQMIVTTGSTVVTTTHWTSPQIMLSSVRGGVTSSLSASDIDLTRSVTTNAGVAAGSTHSGSLTLAATLPGSAWSAALATQGTVSYDTTGAPTQGDWTITLPHNRLGLQLGAGSATVTVDNGPDGTIDHTYTFTIPSLLAAAA
jgi:hypothetical protein